jgi:hypothetical protein
MVELSLLVDHSNLIKLVASGSFLRSWYLLSIYRNQIHHGDCFWCRIFCTYSERNSLIQRDLYEIMSQQQRDDY